MTIYIVLQNQFQEENFGNLAPDNSLIHGVYSTKELAEAKIKTIEVGIFSAQYGDGEETCYIEEFELDK